ncbi:MAG: hypothetical protein LQ340_000891 [Diploschistes diacapsis]|nr:MAG: hypothetical protein LQ340_000891 [Diploschistes diacapsis]
MAPSLTWPRQGLTNNDAIDAEHCWGELATSLRQIHTRNHSELSFEHLYRNSYKLVLKKKGDFLYNNFQDLEREWLQTGVRPKILSNISPSLIAQSVGTATAESAHEARAAGEKLMKALKEAWEDHLLCMSMTTDVLMYMDRVYCDEQRLPKVFPMTMGQFRDYILLASIEGYGDINIVDILTTVVLAQIDMDRNGDIVDKALIRSCMYMLEGLYETDSEDEGAKLYLMIFEPAFLTASRVFYRSEGQKLLNSVDAGSFCRHATNRITEESERCSSTISALTLDKIKSVIDKELISDYMRDVIHLPGSGVEWMLDNNKVDELVMIYDLISRVDSKKEALKGAVQKRIVELGTEINKTAATNSHAQPARMEAQGEKGEKGEKGEGEPKAVPDRPANQQTAAAIQWVDDVLKLKDSYDAVLTNAFRDDPTLQAAFTKSFTDFINAFDRCSEYLSLFFDENMKKGIKGKTETEVDALLDKGIILLRYIQDKDLFERYYKKHLSRRLLMKRSVSMDAERQMMVKMKLEIGNALTTRIEPMFRDMDISLDLTSGYKRHVAGLGDRDLKRADVEVHVLTSTMWPLEAMGTAHRDDESQPTCIFPSSIEKIRQGFQKFYLEKHSGRKLMWQANMGTADIRAYFPKSKGNIKIRELNVSTYAMAILLLFNDLGEGQTLTCAEIQARTNIPMHDLTRNLQSLAVAPKTRVLIKEPMSKDVKPEDRFSFNESFHSPYSKVKIGVVSANRVEDPLERRETERKNDDSRAHIIEAAIVRIMK